MNAKSPAIIVISITPPGPPGTHPWWTVQWDGHNATVRTASGLDGDHPADWGIACTSPDYTDLWRDEGGSAYVVEQILDGFASAGATARITGAHGPAESRVELVTTVQAFVDRHPECEAELKRFAREAAEHVARSM